MDENVLLIDDERSFREQGKRRFSSMRFRMEVASSGPEAVAIGKVKRFDFAIVDLRIKEEDGIKVAAELGKIQEDLPIAFLTGHLTPQARARAESLGVHPFGWYEKPLPASSKSFDDFCATLRTSALDERFRLLSTRWRRETHHSSSISEITGHPSYLFIIGMGRDAVPLILRELRKQPEHWFVALRAITNSDPVSPSHRGDVRAMTVAWLEWADERWPEANS